MNKKEQILNTFKESGKPLKTGELAEKTGMDAKEISKLIKELKTEEKIYSPKRCYYELKK